MIRIAFTGPSHLHSFEHKLVLATLDALPLPQQVTIVTGGCVGVDELVAATLHARGYSVHTVLPAAFRLVDPDYELHCTSHEQTAAGRTLSETYRLRNTRMIGLSTQLIAFLRNSGSPDYRSGEVMTYNIARKANKPTRIVAL